MNVRQHYCGRGERLGPETLGVTREVSFSGDGIFFAVRRVASTKTETICVKPTRY
jgi:hypothetical protein